MAIPTSLADINAFTNRYMVPKATNVVYKDSPLFVRLINRGKVMFPGGTSIIRPIIYGKLNGGAYDDKADTFNTAYVQTEASWQAFMKYYYVNITLYGSDSVLNRGREAAFSLTELKAANAAMRMAELIATDLYKDGQTSSGDVTTSGGLLSGVKSVDGLLAWVDDGNDSGSYATATNLTKSFPVVGGLTRDDLFAVPPTFSGAETPAGGVNAGNSYVHRNITSFSLTDVNKAYAQSTLGNKTVDLILGNTSATVKFYNSILPNQRFTEESSDIAKIGFQSFRFNGATVATDKYAPDQLLLGLNTDFVELHVSNNPKYQMGFTGFKEAQNTDNYSGQFLFAGNLMVPHPGTCFKLVGTGLA